MTVPKGRLRWAAVRALPSKASPLAVRLWSFGRYQEAGPVWVKIGTSASGSCLGAAGGGAKVVATVAGLARRTGAQAERLSARTTTAVSAKNHPDGEFLIRQRH